MTHVHDWKKSKRVHKRPPRFFVECECGEVWQATPNSPPFTTNRKRGKMDNYSIRLPRKPTKAEVRQIQDILKKQKPLA